MVNKKQITIILLIIGIAIITTGLLLVINGFINISHINAENIAIRIFILILGLLPFSIIILLNISISERNNIYYLIRIIALFWLILIVISCITVLFLNI